MDIGSGNRMQGLMMMYAPEMPCTGIDSHIFHDSITDFDAHPGYTFFTLGNGYIFGTKNERDIKKLQANDTVSKKNEITAGRMNRAFYVNMIK